MHAYPAFASLHFPPFSFFYVLSFYGSHLSFSLRCFADNFCSVIKERQAGLALCSLPLSVQAYLGTPSCLFCRKFAFKDSVQFIDHTMGNFTPAWVRVESRCCVFGPLALSLFNYAVCGLAKLCCAFASPCLLEGRCGALHNSRVRSAPTAAILLWHPATPFPAHTLHTTYTCHTSHMGKLVLVCMQHFLVVFIAYFKAVRDG